MWIALSGKPQSGKDTVGRYLMQHHDFTRIAFADPLREMAYDLDPIVGHGLYRSIHLQEVVDEIGWERAKVEYSEVRRTLQRLGTDAIRNHLGPDVWVGLGERTAKDVSNGRVVFTDCRFPNEEYMVLEHSGLHWHIERPGAEDNGHVCEQFRGHPHVTIINDGSVADLEAKAEAMVSRLLYPCR